MSAIIIVALVVLVVIGVVVAVLATGGLAVLLLKLGIVVKEATRPAHLDHGDYSLDQGREVRPEEELPERRR